MDAKFSSILHGKTYFLFYFIHPFLQNTHISLSILHIYSIKYSFFYNFLLFPPLLPFSFTNPQSITTNDHSTPNHHHHHLATITTQPPSSPPNQQHQGKPTQSPTYSILTPLITHPTRNPVKPNHHPPNPKPTDDLMIGEAFV